MTGGILGFLGGIGLFVFGIETMTTALRSLAGEGLRRWLLRMTSTPLRGVLTGAGITAVVQSSTAVLVMVIGFVGAGVISFAQSLGVIYGANIGTTVTGWIVLVAGLRFQIGTVALPVLLIGALLGLFGEGRAGRAGRLLVGLALMFVGLDMMQASAAGIEDLVTPDRLPGDGPAGLVTLALIGLLLVALIQSSSAAIVLTLVFLGSGTIGPAQGAAMVVGINVGATLTEFLASLAGGRETLRIALANLLFNLGTAILVLPGLLALSPLIPAGWTGAQAQTALVVFHTGFNVLGALIFLSLTGPFARLVERLVPSRPVTLAAALDPQLLSDAGTSLDAAARTAMAIADDIGRALQAALAPGDLRDLRPLDGLAGRVDPARAALVTWLARIHLAPDQAAAMDRMGALMHMVDHLARLSARAQERDRIAYLADDRDLGRPARAVAAALVGPRKPGQAARLVALIRPLTLHHRRGALLAQNGAMVPPARAFRETDALRWIDRVADHAERIAHWGALAAGPAAGLAAGPAARPLSLAAGQRGG